MEQPSFNLLGELKNIYVIIPISKALHNVFIYAKTIRDLIVKKQGRKPKYPPTMHVVGKLFELMMGKVPLSKYIDPGNPAGTIFIGNFHI